MKKNEELDQKNYFDNHEDFNNFMNEIDQTLRNNNVKIHARTIVGMAEVAEKLNTTIYGVPKTKAKPNDFSNISLSAHVRKWFDDRYGDRLKINFGFGKTIVMLNEDFYKVSIPLVYGKLKLIFDSSLKNYGFGNEYYNVANLIEGITPDLAKSLDKKNKLHILEQIKKGILLGILINNNNKQDLIEEATGDLVQAVELLFHSKPLSGLSKWESLQFSEKLLKTCLKNKIGKFQKTHNLKKLINKLNKLEIKNIDLINIDSIQCVADVRYNSELVSVKEAVKAHWASVDLGLIILQAL